MNDIVGQGQINIAGTTLNTGNPLSKIFTIRTYNPLACTVRLERYDDLTSSTEVLFEFALAAGDTLTDTTVYVLKENDQLILYSDIAGTAYYVYGTEY